MSQKRTLGLLLAATVLMPLAAQSQTPAECAALTGTEAGDGLKAVKCMGVLAGSLQATLDRVADLETKFETLNQSVASINVEGLRVQLANTVPAFGDPISTKAVVAYYSNKGEKTCPKGWSPYEEAKNRFIVGASTDVYTRVGGVGGESAVTLTEPQMPEHSHGMKSALSGKPLKWYKEQKVHPIPLRAFNSGSEFDWKSGDNLPHNNIPPYIALYFCKKN